MIIIYTRARTGVAQFRRNKRAFYGLCNVRLSRTREPLMFVARCIRERESLFPPVGDPWATVKLLFELFFRDSESSRVSICIRDNGRTPFALTLHVNLECARLVFYFCFVYLFSVWIFVLIIDVCVLRFSCL